MHVAMWQTRRSIATSRYPMFKFRRDEERRSAFAGYTTRVFVLAERNQPRMPQMIVRGPFGDQREHAAAH
jgi:hypothetical protein